MTLHSLIAPAVSVLVLFLPGLVLGVLAGLRASLALVIAPLLTYGITTATATVASYASVRWNPATLAVVTVVAAVLILAVRLVSGRGLPWRQRLAIRRPHRPGWRDLCVAAGVVGGGGLSAAVLLRGFGSLGAPNQDYDYMFHASAVRLIADSGDIAPVALRRINAWESTSFYYPNTMHALAAVVRDLTGASVFEVLNSQAMIVCLVAGLGLAGLLRRLGAPTAVVAATPLLLAGFASFPYDVLWRGPLLPFAAGVATIPALILLLDVMLDRRRPILVLLFGLAAGGVFGLHPSIALSAALFGLVAVLVRWRATPRTVLPDILRLAVAGVLALVVALPAFVGAQGAAGSASSMDWPAVETAGQAVGDLILLDHAARAPQYWLAGLLIVGLLCLHRARYLWAWLGGTAIMVALFVLAASSDSALVPRLTSAWWNDRWRFAALAVLGLAPLAAHGLQMLAELAQRVIRALAGALRDRLPARALTGSLAALGLLLVVVASHGLYAQSNRLRVAPTFADQHTLSATEIAAMEWLGRHSSGGTIMNDSNDGSGYLSAVAGLHPLFGHVVEPGTIWAMGPTQRMLLWHFNCLDADPTVRRDIQRLDIRYVFLGSGYVRPDLTRLVGLQGLSGSPSLQLVHRAPGVQIYAVHLAATPTAPVPACTLPEKATTASGTSG